MTPAEMDAIRIDLATIKYVAQRRLRAPCSPCCTASADDVLILVAEVERLRAERDDAVRALRGICETLDSLEWTAPLDGPKP